MINDLLFVIENHKGISENNMLSTKKEFLNFLTNKGLSDLVDDVDFLLENENSGVQWKSLNIIDGLLEFRRCRDEQDLCDFLDGKYNDSVEKMNERNLHSFGLFSDFKWDVIVSSFSPASISLLSSLKEKNAALNDRCRVLFSQKSSLDDIIRNCVQNHNGYLKQAELHVKSSFREI